MERILFATCLPEYITKEMIKQGIVYTQAAQKFNQLIVKGLCLNGCDVDVLCVVKEPGFNFPDSYSEIYAEHTVSYHFCNLKGNMLSRNQQKKRFISKEVRDWARNNPGGVVIVDSLSPIAVEISKQAKKNRLKLVTHVTDFRDFLYKPSSIKQKIWQYILNRQFYSQFSYTTSFVLLTDAMKDRIKIKNRKCVLIDGLCDYDLTNQATTSYHSDKKVFLYTGSISYMFGLKNLVEGFIKADMPNAELHLYGWGDYVEELKQTVIRHPNIRYFSTVPNYEIVKKQAEATYCVNPRPVGDTYTKYSFPSKTIEYLVAGRPVITTHLPCITAEYDPHLFYFDNDTIDGIAETLKRCYHIDNKVLSEQGDRARQYILTEKNNKKQVSKILDSIKL